MNHVKKMAGRIISGLLLITFVLSVGTMVVQAQTNRTGATPSNMPDNSNVEYTLLEPLPDLSTPSKTVKEIAFKDYVQYMFNLIIALSAAAAVFMIVFGGFQYMTTDSWKGKSEGITRVKHALLGLLLVLGSYLLLRTIDPRLVAIPSTLVKPLEIKYKNVLTDYANNLADEIRRLDLAFEETMLRNKDSIEKERQLNGDIADIDAEIARALEDPNTSQDYIDQLSWERTQLITQKGDVRNTIDTDLMKAASEKTLSNALSSFGNKDEIVSWLENIATNVDNAEKRYLTQLEGIANAKINAVISNGGSTSSTNESIQKIKDTKFSTAAMIEIEAEMAKYLYNKDGFLFQAKNAKSYIDEINKSYNSASLKIVDPETKSALKKYTDDKIGKISAAHNL